MEDISTPEFILKKDLEDSLDSTGPKNEEGLEKNETDELSVTIFGWGNTVNGELGLGGLEEEHISDPTKINVPAGRVKSSIYSN